MKPLVKNENETNDELVILQHKLDTLTMLPKKKYNYPMTSAQEVGWDMDTEFGIYKPKYAFSKTECAECKYANDYVTMTKRSPYAMKRAEGGPATTSPTKKWLPYYTFKIVHILHRSLI